MKKTVIYDYESVAKISANRTKFFTEILQKSGIRFYNENAKRLEMAFLNIKNNYTDIKSNLESIVLPTELEQERHVADFVRKRFKGIGLKQSRNILQMLGLSQHVIPIDTRLMKSLRKNGGVNIPEKNLKLQNESVYNQIEDQINELCLLLEIKPCIFDAVIFISER